MNTNRTRRARRQWPFLLVLVMLIGVSACSSRSCQSQLPPVVNRSTITVASVERGTMTIHRRGLGVLAPADYGRLKAVIQMAAIQAKGIRIGQPASIDTRQGIISGKVINVGSDASDGVIPVDISLEGDLPQGAIAGMNIDGFIEIDRLNDVLYLQRPAFGREGDVSSLFKLEEDGANARRAVVKVGKAGIPVVEILEGLNVGDKVIISDMSGYEGVNTIRLN